MDEPQGADSGPDNLLAMPRFAGITTFFRLPHQPSSSSSPSELPRTKNE